MLLKVQATSFMHGIFVSIRVRSNQGHLVLLHIVIRRAARLTEHCHYHNLHQLRGVLKDSPEVLEVSSTRAAGQTSATLGDPCCRTTHYHGHFSTIISSTSMVITLIVASELLKLKQIIPLKEIFECQYYNYYDNISDISLPILLACYFKPRYTVRVSVRYYGCTSTYSL